MATRNDKFPQGMIAILEAVCKCPPRSESIVQESCRSDYRFLGPSAYLETSTRRGYGL